MRNLFQPITSLASDLCPLPMSELHLRPSSSTTPLPWSSFPATVVRSSDQPLLRFRPTNSLLWQEPATARPPSLRFVADGHLSRRAVPSSASFHEPNADELFRHDSRRRREALDDLEHTINHEPGQQLPAGIPPVTSPSLSLAPSARNQTGAPLEPPFSPRPRLLLCLSSPSSHHPHPLDPLSPSEISTVTNITNNHFHHFLLSSSKSLTFQYVGLDEPDKSELHAYLSNPSHTALPLRRAFVIVRLDRQTHEIYVDVRNRRVVSDRIYGGSAYPILSFGEQFAATLLPQNYTPFVESVRKRGEDMRDVTCTTFSVGWFGEAEKGRRAIKILCFLTGDSTVNLYMRPLEGITVVVDLDVMDIVEYEDRLTVKVPKADGTDYRAAKQRKTYGPRGKPVTVVQPEGKGFQFDGHLIRWANWHFHLGFDHRAGTIISLASVQDPQSGAHRSVLYRGFVSELFVPYMDPSEEWYYKTFFDAGEYGFGMSASTLQPMTDCPANAAFMDGYYTDWKGNPTKLQNVICVFERYAGNPSWRHTET